VQTAASPSRASPASRDASYESHLYRWASLLTATLRLDIGSLEGSPEGRREGKGQFVKVMAAYVTLSASRGSYDHRTSFRSSKATPSYCWGGDVVLRIHVDTVRGSAGFYAEWMFDSVALYYPVSFLSSFYIFSSFPLSLFYFILSFFPSFVTLSRTSLFYSFFTPFSCLLLLLPFTFLPSLILRFFVSPFYSVCSFFPSKKKKTAGVVESV
jgi:hypothetical protein